MREQNYDPAVDWARFDQPLFDRFAESLLSRAHPDAEVEVVSDSGGDGGRDLVVREVGTLTIYQFKFWTGDVTSTPASRKTQIEKSFISALQHDPDQWILVAPAKFNDAMKRFVHTLPARKRVKDSGHDASRVTIRLFDVLKLDQLLIEHSEAIALIQKEDPAYRYMLDQLTAQDLGPIKKSDLLDQAVKALTDRIETGSVNWDARLDYRNGRPRVLPIARHPHAQALEPIRTKYLLQLPPNDSSGDVAELFDRMFAYGSGPVEISRDHITMLEYEGPEIFRDALLDDGDATSWLFRPPALEVDPGPFLLVLTQPDDEDIQIPATVNQAAQGAFGGTINFDCGSGLTVTIRADRRSDSEWQASFSLSPERIGVTEYLRAVEHALAIQRATMITLVSPSGEEGRLKRNTLPVKCNGATEPSETDLLEASVRDLVTIQRLQRQPLSMPDAMTGMDRIMIRSLRLALEGHLVPYPFTEQRVSLKEGASIEAQLEATAAGHGAAFLAQSAPDVAFKLGDNRITLPPLMYFHPNCMYSFVDESARRFRAVAPEGEVFVMYAPDLISGRPAVATPWGLPDVTEPRTPPIEWVETDETEDEQSAGLKK